PLPGPRAYVERLLGRRPPEQHRGDALVVRLAGVGDPPVPAHVLDRAGEPQGRRRAVVADLLVGLPDPVANDADGFDVGANVRPEVDRLTGPEAAREPCLLATQSQRMGHLTQLVVTALAQRGPDLTDHLRDVVAHGRVERVLGGSFFRA